MAAALSARGVRPSDILKWRCESGSKSEKLQMTAFGEKMFTVIFLIIAAFS